jgi:hypothetical protein
MSDKKNAAAVILSQSTTTNKVGYSTNAAQPNDQSKRLLTL